MDFITSECVTSYEYTASSSLATSTQVCTDVSSLSIQYAFYALIMVLIFYAMIKIIK